MKHYHNLEETQKVGKRIQTLRRKNNLSIEDVASMTGFTRHLLRAVENGKNTDTSHLIEISKAIGVHPMEFFNIDFEIKPRYKLPHTRESKELLTFKLTEVSQTDFFNTPKFVADVLIYLNARYKINPDSTTTSVILKRLVNEGKLNFEKVGRKNAYIKRDTKKTL